MSDTTPQALLRTLRPAPGSPFRQHDGPQLSREREQVLVSLADTARGGPLVDRETEDDRPEAHEHVESQAALPSIAHVCAEGHTGWLEYRQQEKRSEAVGSLEVTLRKRQDTWSCCYAAGEKGAQQRSSCRRLVVAPVGSLADRVRRTTRPT